MKGREENEKKIIKKNKKEGEKYEIN